MINIKISRVMEDLVELYRTVACSLPEDVINALSLASDVETGRSASALSDLLKNVKIAKEGSIPMCQDTGTPIWDVDYGQDYTECFLRDVIIWATDEATEVVPLRTNAVDILTDMSKGNEPVIYFNEVDEGLRLRLMLKGGGSENIGQLYKLPDLDLDADRNMAGVKKCVYDAVYNAQGKGCPPYILGVSVGGSVDVVTRLAKEQLFRKLNDKNINPELDSIETELTDNINKMGIGAAGYGGKTTALGVKMAVSKRHPASFFVYVAFNCWAMRRGELKYD